MRTVKRSPSKLVAVDAADLTVAGRRVRALRLRDPAVLPWKELGVDLELTRVIDGDLLKIMSWYDNEWGYANQMLREALSLLGVRQR